MQGPPTEKPWIRTSARRHCEARLVVEQFVIFDDELYAKFAAHQRLHAGSTTSGCPVGLQAVRVKKSRLICRVNRWLKAVV